MTPPFLLYHKIDTPTRDIKIRGAFTAPRVFERQMIFLKKRGWKFFHASALLRHFADHGDFPANSLAVTFDDGWKDNYTYAFPILNRLEIKATVFLVPACVGRTTDLVTAEGEGPREHLSADEIREMADAGIEFGSHSMNHVLMNKADEATVRTEIFDSKAAIENLTQRPCMSFAYPAGFFSDTAKRYVREAGYFGALSTVYGDDARPDVFALNRLEILRRDGRPFQFGRKIQELSR